MEETKNAAAKIADLMSTFMEPVGSSDKEILDTVARYSLQISPEQHLVINRLQLLCLDERVPEKVKRALESFIPQYQEMKRYHDTLPFIGRTIESLSLKRFLDQQSIKGNVTKMV